MTNTDAHEMKRRDFLGKFIKIFFLSVFVVLSSVLLYLYPSANREKSLRFFYLMEEENLPARGIRRVDFEYMSEERSMLQRIFLSMSDKGPIAFSSVCTHLGCLINWDNNKKEFLCPCHGGRYNMNGDVIAGPPPKALTRLPLDIKDGKVYIGVKV